MRRKSSVHMKAVHMKAVAHPALAATSALAAALLCAGTAFAQPGEDEEAPQPQSAADTIAQLQSEGHSVVVRGNDQGTLVGCDVASVSKAGDASNTMIVEVNCTPDYQG
ncbi:hypothetical protein C6A87_002035 [Mycobacterium sp. ITM-2016-00317]|uniref:hypothetical protein n=1 Tax=Mycobacterium sp. ITM-2016-00317 TaxID=2099694 RepID=UPI00115BA283|nr:hypothetical protein [Mycobacterium sp. ITM-2016-00317]WNG88077.1 hypothetical protein C6A87_002035 [Mycobacterium sp. ITM-2016-00317]